MAQDGTMQPNIAQQLARFTPGESELLTPAQLADVLKITRQGVSNLKSRGRIRPAIACGKIIRYSLPDVIAQMAPAQPEIQA